MVLHLVPVLEPPKFVVGYGRWIHPSNSAEDCRKSERRSLRRAFLDVCIRFSLLQQLRANAQTQLRSLLFRGCEETRDRA